MMRFARYPRCMILFVLWSIVTIFMVQETGADFLSCLFAAFLVSLVLLIPVAFIVGCIVNVLAWVWEVRNG